MRPGSGFFTTKPVVGPPAACLQGDWSRNTGGIYLRYAAEA